MTRQLINLVDERFGLSTIGPHPGDGYSLDRINNEVGYFPGNVRWATAAQQMANRSPSQEGQPA